MLKSLRSEVGYTVRELSAESGVQLATIAGLEAGEILSPQVDTLMALASALCVSVADLFTVADWLPAGELPTLKPYLRVKYRELDDAAIADLERYAERLADRRGITGPLDHEDEDPE
jgi:transcriptional regulator with XRE-family HTH domain